MDPGSVAYRDDVRRMDPGSTAYRDDVREIDPGISKRIRNGSGTKVN